MALSMKLKSSYTWQVYCTDQDGDARLRKARSTFSTMDRLWKSKIITGRATKVNIFNSNVKVVLLYASVCRAITHRTFCYQQMPMYCGIINTHSLYKIANKELTIEQLWNWLGHTMRTSDYVIAKQALYSGH